MGQITELQKPKRWPFVVADLDQYSINDVIISSLENRPRSCASIVAAEEGRDLSEYRFTGTTKYSNLDIFIESK